MRHEAADLLLRLGTALALLYPSIDAFLNPFTWVGFLPEFFRDALPEMFALHLFNLICIVLAVWILSGRKIFVPALTATVLLLLIVIFNGADFDIVFRDLSIAAMTLALAIMHRPIRRQREA